MQLDGCKNICSAGCEMFRYSVVCMTACQHIDDRSCYWLNHFYRTLVIVRQAKVKEGTHSVKLHTGRHTKVVRNIANSSRGKTAHSFFVREFHLRPALCRAVVYGALPALLQLSSQQADAHIAAQYFDGLSMIKPMSTCVVVVMPEVPKLPSRGSEIQTYGVCPTSHVR